MKRKTTARAAREIMNPRVEALEPSAPITAAIHTLMRRGYAGAPVVDPQQRMLGVLSEQDCIRALADSVFEGWPAGTVADHMSSEVESVGPDEDVFTVASRFSSGGHRRVFVVDGERLVGIISRRDLLRALEAMRGESAQRDRSDTYTLIQIRHHKYD